MWTCGDFVELSTKKIPAANRFAFIFDLEYDSKKFKNNHLIWIESTVGFQNAGALIDFMQSYITKISLKLQNWMKKNCLHFFFSCLHNTKFLFRLKKNSSYINNTKPERIVHMHSDISGYVLGSLKWWKREKKTSLNGAHCDDQNLNLKMMRWNRWA